MMKKLTMFGVLAAVLLLAPAPQTPARALSGLKAGAAKVDGVTEVGHRFRGGGPAIYFGGQHHHPGFALQHHPNFAFQQRPNFAFQHHRDFAFDHHRRHFRFGPRIFVGVPYPYYASSYSYDGCYWLKVRAIRTGDPYWWWRYQECRDW